MCVVVDAIKTNQDAKTSGEWRSSPRHDLVHRRLHRATKTNQPLTQTGKMSFNELLELKIGFVLRFLYLLHDITQILCFKLLLFSGLSLVPLWRRPHSLRLSAIENPVRPGLRLPAFSHMEQSLEGEPLGNKSER